MNTAIPSGPQAALIAFAIRYRGIVIAFSCLLVVFGLYSLFRAKYDVFPEFAPPQVGIQTEAPGLSSEQVEVLVTRPIEIAVGGVPAIQTVRSTSIQGLSLITLFFDPSSDIYRDRQVVAERLSVVAQQLPEGVQAPAMTPLTSSTSIVLVVGLTSAQRSLMELRTAAEWTVEPRLLAVPGVAKVAVFGGDEKSLQIQVHPDELIRYGLGLNDVLAAARRATGVRGAGFIDTPNQRVVLQTEGQSLTAAELARTVVLSRGAANVTLGDVARIAEAPVPPIGAAMIQGKPGVIFNVSEQYGANTVEVTNQLEAALRDLRPTLEAEGMTLDPALFRPANFIATSTDNVRDSLILGGVLVAAVIFLFLFDVRTAAISCVAIPLSLLAAMIVLERSSITINIMTLGGLAISIGVVVDDAVIDVENIVRRLRENGRLAEPRPVARVMLDACLELRSAVVYATFAVILVVLPIMALSGIAGRLFGPLGLAFVLAVLASLVVALTVTPALAMALIAGRTAAHDPPLVRWTRDRYERLLRRVAHHPRALMAAAALFTLAGLATLPFFAGSFIPELQEGHFDVHLAAVPGTSLAESMRVAGLIDAELKRVPGVRSVAQRVGRAELADDIWGTHYSEVEVDLKPDLTADEAEAATAAVRKVFAGFVGINASVLTPLSERVEETLSGYRAAVAVNVFGNDLDVLDRKADEIARVLRDIPGASEIQIQSPPGLPQLSIRLRKPDLERWGFDAVEVLDLIRTAYQGNVVGQTYEGNRVFNVMALLDRHSRRDIAMLGDLPLRSPGGSFVPLKQIADIYQSAGRYQVLHEDARRLQTVTANVEGRDVTSFVAAAKRAIAAKVKLPAGTYLQFSGTAEAEARATRDLLVNSLIVGAGIVLLLTVVTRNWRNLMLILANLPFALVGGVLAAWATGGVLSLGGMIGFVALFGITLRNSILMIAHYEHLVVVERASWGLDAAIRGATDRLAPILMTSIVTGLGVLPLAIGMGDPGREIEGPMAAVILGGLLTSMVLNLLVLPTLALRFGRFEPVVDELGVEGPVRSTGTAE